MVILANSMSYTLAIIHLAVVLRTYGLGPKETICSTRYAKVDPIRSGGNRDRLPDEVPDRHRDRALGRGGAIVVVQREVPMVDDETKCVYCDGYGSTLSGDIETRCPECAFRRKYEDCQKRGEE